MELSRGAYPRSSISGVSPLRIFEVSPFRRNNNYILHFALLPFYVLLIRSAAIVVVVALAADLFGLTPNWVRSFKTHSAGGRDDDEEEGGNTEIPRDENSPSRGASS